MLRTLNNTDGTKKFRINIEPIDTTDNVDIDTKILDNSSEQLRNIVSSDYNKYTSQLKGRYKIKVDAENSLEKEVAKQYFDTYSPFIGNTKELEE
jgi:uncharacterized protein YacL